MRWLVEASGYAVCIQSEVRAVSSRDFCGRTRIKDRERCSGLRKPTDRFFLLLSKLAVDRKRSTVLDGWSAVSDFKRTFLLATAKEVWSA